jgi:hypothetical protein
MPARSVNEARIRATHEAAMAIIAAERKKRDEKTARLRAAREAAEQAREERASKAPNPRKKQASTNSVSKPGPG